MAKRYLSLKQIDAHQDINRLGSIRSGWIVPDRIVDTREFLRHERWVERMVNKYLKNKGEK